MRKSDVLRAVERERLDYRGWSMGYSARAPVTGAWRATRHGVGMCAGTADALKRMIDAKHAEEDERRRTNPLWAPNI
jgi:hypothetical protein